MKKILLIVLLFLCSKIYSQSADTSDYFSVGLYGVGYSSPISDLKNSNDVVSGIGIEAEYVKSKSLSFYAKFIHQFTSLSNNFNYYDLPVLSDPTTYREIFAFGARYYLRDNLVKPYFQLGLVHERIYIGTFLYNYHDYETGIVKTARTSRYGIYSYLLNTGVGISFKIYKRLYADFQYDLNWILKAKDYRYNGFTTVGGLKYNIVL